MHRPHYLGRPREWKSIDQSLVPRPSWLNKLYIFLVLSGCGRIVYIAAATRLAGGDFESLDSHKNGGNKRIEPMLELIQINS